MTISTGKRFRLTAARAVELSKAENDVILLAEAMHKCKKAACSFRKQAEEWETAEKALLNKIAQVSSLGGSK